MAASMSLDGLKDLIGYKFNNESLLEQAITHSTYISKKEVVVGTNGTKEVPISYSQLAWLGDSVLNHLVTDHLYQCYLNDTVHQLTVKRQHSVKNEILAAVAKSRGIDQYLRHRMQPGFGVKILGTLIEAIIGAVYIDSGKSLNSMHDIIMHGPEIITAAIFLDFVLVSVMIEIFTEWIDEILGRASYTIREMWTASTKDQQEKEKLEEELFQDYRPGEKTLVNKGVIIA